MKIPSSLNLTEAGRIADHDYCGRILYGNYSREIKKRISEYISHFQALDEIGNLAIPYISAWRDEEKIIWYEFAGSRLTEILGCEPAQVAHVFRLSIVDRCIYRYPTIDSSITKETLDRNELLCSRQLLREESKKKGGIEAVYKIAPGSGRVFWFKDQANIEIFPRDNICLSPGMLVDVTKEMEAEAELKRVQRQLKLHRNRLGEMVKDRTRELRKTQLDIVYRLARAAEYRDNDTGQHVTKMSRYCAILGHATGLKRDLNTLLYHAAPMHDVGKIGISDRILLKPTRLNREEFELMKTHCTIGAELLAGHDSALLRVARNIALTHHEKWDGSGYPRGLAGENIPLAGRIAAVCDVFDALTSKRPYKQPWEFDKAVAELHQGKGTHFDPHLVDLFIEHLPTVREAYGCQDA